MAFKSNGGDKGQGQRRGIAGIKPALFTGHPGEGKAGKSRKSERGYAVAMPGALRQGVPDER